LSISLIKDERRSLHCKTVANDSSTTHFLVGVSSVSLIVKFGVISTQPAANEIAGVNDKSNKSTTMEVFIFVFCVQP